MYDGAPYVDEWKPLPPRLHDTVVEEVVVTVRPCAVAAREVTNAEFADFLAATGYRPLGRQPVPAPLGRTASHLPRARRRR